MVNIKRCSVCPKCKIPMDKNRIGVYHCVVCGWAGTKDKLIVKGSEK